MKGKSKLNDTFSLKNPWKELMKHLIEEGITEEIMDQVK